MKNEEYYINECSSKNEVSRSDTKYGYSKTYSVEDKIVTLYFNQYANGSDDFDDELVQVEIKNKSMFDIMNETMGLPAIILGK